MTRTSQGLVQFVETALVENWGYCLGTFGQILTRPLLTQKMQQGLGVGAYNTKHKTYLEKFINKRVSDCYGLVKAYLWWTNDNPKYNASQDINQEMAYSKAKEKGPINTIPEIPGLILWMKGHAGIYIGNGEFIECVGSPVGMRKGKIKDGKVISGSKFTHWFKDTNIQYPTEMIKLTICGQIKHIKGYHKDGANYVKVKDKDYPIRDVLESLGFKDITGKGNEVQAK